MDDHECLPKDVVPYHYQIHLSPNFETFLFDGEEIVELEVVTETNKIVANALDLSILSFEVSQGSTSVPVSDFTLDSKAETVSFNLHSNLAKGKAVLKIKFTGTLNDLMCGFYRSSYEVGDTKKWMASTQFEAVDARRAFVCWDEPSLKATFDVQLTVPKGMTALSNMHALEETESTDGRRTFRFARTPKMSTYIVAFAVGEFDHIEARTKEGVTVRVYSTPGKSHLGQFSLGIATETLSYFNEYFGTPYPLSKVDMIAVPDFAAGAMENWGLITYREIALLVDERQTPAARKARVAETVAHELAHQWFGNLVTMEWWSHLWLNEGFATWVASLALDKLFPQWRVWELFLTGNTAGAFGLDALESSHPVEVPVATARKIDEIFDEISYSKGGSVIRMIWAFLGESTFREGLRQYLKTHAYGNASTNDLWKALADASGKPVEAIMASWTRQTGLPVLSVHREGSELVLRQRRFLSSGPRDSDAERWIVPVTAITSDGQSLNFMMDKPEMRVPLTLAAGGWVKLNAEQTGFYRVHYADTHLFAALCDAVKSNALSTMDRYGIVNDAFALARAAVVSTADVLRLMDSLQGEDSYIVAHTVVMSLEKMLHVFFNEPFTPQLQKFARRVLRPLLGRLGLTVSEGEDHQRTLLRSEVIGCLSDMDDETLIQQCLRMFENVDTIAPDLRQAVFNTAAAHGGMDAFEKLVQMYNAATLSEQKVRILRAMGQVREPAAVQRALDFAKSDAVRSQDFVFVYSALGGSPSSGDAAWRFMRENWDFIHKRYGKGGFLFSDLCQSSFDSFHDAGRIPEVEAFFREHPAPSAEKAIAQGIESVQLSHAWRQRDEGAVAAFLDSVHY